MRPNPYDDNDDDGGGGDYI